MRCGIAPYFTKEGKLELKKTRGQVHELQESAVLRAAMYREKRYGVISEVTVIDRKSGEKQAVKNESFCARGGLCKRVLYVSPGSTDTRTTAAYQIEKSEQDSRLLVLVLSGASALEPGDSVRVSLAKLGVKGTFCVNETCHRCDSGGEITEVTLWGV